MRLSLRYRLLIPLALLLSGDAVATAWAARNAAYQAERQLALQQWAVARALTEPPFFPLTETILKKMQNLSGAEFLFTHPAMPPQSTFPPPLPPPPDDVPTAEHPQADDEPILGPPVVVAGQEYRCLRLPLKPPHPNAGGNLYIFYPESLRQTAVADAVRPLLILGGVGGLLAVGLAYGFGSQLVRRVRDLDARTRQIAAGDFRPLPLPRSHDELGDLCNAVNTMARQLAEFQQALQQSERLKVLGQFSGGLAHQLRNAAAGAKLAIELFLAENPHADPEPLQVALRQLARIETNVRQFLALGKPPGTVREPCDLGQLIDQSVSLLKPQAQHLGTQLVWERPTPPLLLGGDPTALAHLLSNVIGNAVEAAGPGGTVTITAQHRGPDIHIEVSDTGPGPPPEIAANLFDPFVSGKDQGIGLGLAVAKQAAEAHGGTIHWQRRNERTIFTIQLPA
jgi:signal transduction histidine kinase